MNKNPTPAIVLRSMCFAIGYTLTAIAFAIPGVLLYPFSFRWRYGFISHWAKFNIWWLRVTCNLRFEVEGRENIPVQACVVLCKHQSAWETLALQCVFPPQVWVLKKELLWIPFFGWGLAMLEPIAINRGDARKALKSLLTQGTQRLRAGRWVVVFPEGTRVPVGEQKPFQIGGAKLAEHAGVPVVPVAHNAGVFWPRKSFLKFPGVIKLVVGPPISTEGQKATAVNAHAEAWIREHSDRLLEK